MGDGFDVRPSQLQAAATVARQAGAGLAKVDLAGDASAIRAAMAGGDTATAAGHLSTSWSRTVHDLASRTGDHGDRLATSAEVYQHDDGSASAVLGTRVLLPGFEGSA